LEQLDLPAEIRLAVEAHARFCLPEEACGLLAVDGDGRIRMAYALTNIERSSVRFTVAPREHYGAIRHAERNGWEIAGSFHSHPDAPAVPSSRDVAAALDPKWLHLVVGMVNGSVDVRGYRIRNGEVDEVLLREMP
jgi:proteasome lid subunit RPN8/RPN11